MVFVLFSGDRKMPGWLERLGNVLPAAIMGVLLVYCLKGIKTDFLGTGIPGIIAAILTGIAYKWKHNTSAPTAYTITHMRIPIKWSGNRSGRKARPRSPRPEVISEIITDIL
ncbi:MAG: AzlD domain-containing protein [Catonella sp.]|nr:AzlD domain-containing protein [Catonella sp.]